MRSGCLLDQVICARALRIRIAEPKWLSPIEYGRSEDCRPDGRDQGEDNDQTPMKVGEAPEDPHLLIIFGGSG